MPNKLKYLQLQKLDQHIAEVHVCDRPSDGWIRAIRKSLGMNARQLAQRIGITQQAVSQLEIKELDDSVTIETLRNAAAAMDCKFVYALIPNDGSLEANVKKQAFKKATELVTAVDHTMQLEAQGVGDVQIKIKEIADELAKNPNSKLWD